MNPILKNWNIIRIVRLLMGLFLLWLSILAGSWLLIIMAGGFIYSHYLMQDAEPDHVVYLKKKIIKTNKHV